MIIYTINKLIFSLGNVPLLVLSNQPFKIKHILFVIIYDKENHQILTFEKLASANFRHLCLNNDY